MFCELKKITSSDGPLGFPSKKPLANVDQVIHPDRYLQTCTINTTPDTIHDSLNMVSFSLPKIREVQKHRKKIPLPDGLHILIVHHWDFATMISVVLLKHGPSSFPTPSPTTKICTNPWNFFPHRCGAPNLPPMGGASAITVNGFCQLSSCSKTTPSEGKRR